MENIKKYQSYIIIFFVGLVLLWVYQQGKKSTGIDKVKLPNGGKGIPEDWKLNEVVLLIDEFEKVTTINPVYGLSNNRLAVYNKLSALTNDQIVFLNNAYNAKYKNGGGFFWTDESMYERLTSSLKGYVSFSKVYDTLVLRFEQLGLK